MHSYHFFSFFFLLFFYCVLSLFLIDYAWHPSANLVRLRTLFVLGLPHLLIFSFPLFMFGSMIRRLLNVVFIWSAMWFCRTLPTLLYPMSFTVGDENLFKIPLRCPIVFIQEFYSNMHGNDISVPQFTMVFRGTRIVVTPDLVSETLHVPRVAHPNYPTCQHLRTVSKDELLSHFYETPFIWGEN